MSDNLWRTETGHCIARTLLNIESEAGRSDLPSQITIDTTAPESDRVTSVTLTLSPTPIASAIQITAASQSEPREDVSERSEMSQEVAIDTSQSGKQPSQKPQISSSSAALKSVAAAAAAESGIAVVNGSELHLADRSVSEKASHEHLHGSPMTNAGINHSHHNGLPPVAPKKSHTFIYRWFHSGHSQAPSRAASSELMDSAAETGSQNGAVHSSRSSASSQEGHQKHTLIYRLFHPHEHHHHIDEEQHVGIGHSHMDSPQAARRHALISKLFHQTHHHASDDDHSERSSATPSPSLPHLHISGLFSGTIRKKQRSQAVTPSASAQASNHASAEHSEAEISSESSATSTDHYQSQKSAEHLPTIASSNDGSRKASADTSGAHPPLPKERRSLNSMFRQLLMPPKNRRAMGVVASHDHDATQLTEKYGQAEKVIGKGAGGTVRLFHKIGFSGPHDRLYAVKEFRKKRKGESERDYLKKLTSEFCISSNLHHVNIVETLDLVQDENHRWCEIMEYVSVSSFYV